MKNMVKLLGIAALVAVIGFTVSGCGDPTAPTITTTTLPGSRTGTPYTATLAASGTTPITWSIESGTLPTGLSLSGNTISGTPTATGTSTFTVKAANSAGSDTQPLSITIGDGLSMATAIPLTENQWADGNLPTSSDEQWFKFTATASTQWIHFFLDALTQADFWMYDSDYSGGHVMGMATDDDGVVNWELNTLTPEQTYYLKVNLSIFPGSNSIGTYKIAFNTSTTAPTLP